MALSEINTDWTPEVKALLNECSADGGMLRKLMNRNEIKLANKLAKQGVLFKGTSEDKQKSVCFFAVRN